MIVDRTQPSEGDEMRIPGFTAEESLQRSPIHYVGASKIVRTNSDEVEASFLTVIDPACFDAKWSMPAILLWA
jgi:hypothetical protein